MLERSKIGGGLRLILWAGLLLIEAGFVAEFYVVSRFHPQTYDTHPALRLETDAVGHQYPWLRATAIVLLGLFVLANIALIIVIWRAFEDLRASE